MNLSIFARNLRGPFMIHPQQVAAMMPVVHGILAGMEFDLDDSERHGGAKVSCAEFYTGHKAQLEDGSYKSVFVTHLEGTMGVYDSCESYGTRTIAAELLKADADPEVVGHIIVTDSGGGAADSVPELAEAIQKLTKPVVAWIDGMAASAAIYAISYCDRIIAHRPMNQVGCVGTMITISGWPQFRRDGDGYVRARIYADQSEEKNLDYEQALQGNARIIKEDILNPLAQQFIDDMKANRPNCTDDQLKGRTYFAKDAVGSFIDAIGSMEDAVAAVLDLAESKQTNSSKQMAKYQNLESIPELQEQVYAEDGSTVLQECQLQAVEDALASRGENADLTAQVATLTQTVADRDATIAQHEDTIAQRDARIAELESALDAAVERGAQEQPATVEVAADPANAEESSDAPARNYEEAVAECRKRLNRN